MKELKINILEQNKEDILIRYKKGDSFKNIGLVYKVNRGLVARFIRTFVSKERPRGVSEIFRTNTYDRNYFEAIDTKDKAYFLGLLYADGCNNGRGFQIGLSGEDKQILEIFKSKIDYSGNLTVSKSKNTNCKDQHILRINSNYLSLQLNNLGCVKAKTFILKFPDETIMFKDLLSHFIRGYFDGDGCIHLGKDSTEHRFIVLGTENLLNGIREIFTENCKTGNVKISKNGNIHRLSYSGKSQLKRIREYLYQDCEDLFLIRKKEKFDYI